MTQAKSAQVPDEKKTSSERSGMAGGMNVALQPEINIGTLGHVDNGKSTIVQALTGVWTARHSEELRRGITIRIGYADASFYECPKESPPSSYSTSPVCPNDKSPTKLLRSVSF